MRGQGKRKKVKVDPRLAGGGGEREENDGGAAENLPGDGQHPLLNELVMEMLFKKFLLLNHDDSPKSAAVRLAELRPVCKAWNQEISKMTRNETRINVKRLISPYPKGLGWAAITSTPTTGEQQDDRAFEYSVPMPEAIGIFENLTVTIKTCADFTSTSVLQWFQMMGSSVKCLDLACSLNCYHQNRFLEKILKNWCPNLVSLTFRGVQCFESLIHNSFFAEASLENQCKSLKKFILFFEDLPGEQSKSQWSDSCGLTIEDLETSLESQPIQDNKARKEVYEKQSAFVKKLVKYVDKAGEPNTSVGQERALLSHLVGRPIGLNSLDGMTPRTFGSHVADFFQENFSCDPGYESDGGVIGQLMKMSKVEKFVIQKANVKQEWIFDELFAMFFYRPNLWRSSLQHFECLGHYPAVIIVRFRRISVDDSDILPKNIFSKMGFPLKRLKLDKGFLLCTEQFEEQSMRRTLSGYAETLEELEIGLGANGYYQRVITLPVLPSLKVLVVQCKGSCVVKVSSQDILGKLPKLEKCVLTLGQKGYGTENCFFQYDPVWNDRFWEDGGSQGHPLKELKLLDERVEDTDIERMVMCFPNLKSVDLSIVPEGGNDFKGFWEKMGDLSELEQVKISFSVKSRRDKAYDLWENAIGDNIDGFNELQWLELVHEALHPFPLTSRMANGFAKATKLKVLKFTNFQLDGNVEEEMKKNLPDVVVQLPVIKSSVARRMNRQLK